MINLTKGTRIGEGVLSYTRAVFNNKTNDVYGMVVVKKMIRRKYIITEGLNTFYTYHE